MSYATLAELKARLDITGTLTDSALTDALDWATDWIDQTTHRTFVASGTLTRYFDRDALDPDDRQVLWLDKELLTLATLTNGDEDSTAIASSLYDLLPRNETNKNAVRLKSGTVWDFETDYTVALTGTWGYSATPPSLVEGCCLRLAEWKHRSKDMLDTTTVFSEQATRVRPPAFPTEVYDEATHTGALAPLVKLV